MTVLVEQNLAFIAALSQRALIIQKGRIRREVSPPELEDPRLVGGFVGVASDETLRAPSTHVARRKMTS
jgi:branched-chain amino acid transport system ATP-binding protein